MPYSFTVYFLARSATNHTTAVEININITDKFPLVHTENDTITNRTDSQYETKKETEKLMRLRKEIAKREVACYELLKKLDDQPEERKEFTRFTVSFYKRG